MDELWRESASSLAALIRSGEVTSREVVEAHLERVEEVNGSVNAIVEVRPDEVRAEADAADDFIKTGKPLGVLHGVPFTIKVSHDVAGYASNEGTVALKDLVATQDAPTDARLRAAGAVALARTNMPDLGLRMNTESSLYGATHNPWRHGYTAGGSSGGEAAALATGMSPIGIGGDVGGSLRSPAYACGIASIKPSRGRVPGINPSATYDPGLEEQVMGVSGIMARHVDDVVLALQVVMGSHPIDPQSVDVAYRGRDVARRVALVATPTGGTTDPDVAEGVRAAGRALEAAGYEVDEVEPPMLFEAYFAWAELISTNLSVNGALLMSLIGEGGQRFLELTDVEFAPSTPESLYVMHQSRWRVARAWRTFMSDYPLVVGPTWTQPPFELGFDILDQESAMKVVEMVRFSLPANLMGLPAACVPTGTVNGFPTGAQVIANLYREDLCLGAARVVEEAVGVLTPIDPRD
jgi:amidase